jgi:hypothetical protein
MARVVHVNMDAPYDDANTIVTNHLQFFNWKQMQHKDIISSSGKC